MKKTLFLFSLLSLTVLGFSQITLESGAQLIISSGSTVIANDGIVNNNGSINNSGTVEIKGNLENNNSALITLSSTGTVKFNGTSAQEITGTADADFYGTVVIDNANGVSLTATSGGSDQTINGDLTFTAGLLTLNGFNLSIGANDPTGVGSTEYVQTNSSGTVKRTVGASDVLFPIGNSAYNPIILNNAGTSDTYGVLAVDAEPAAGSTAHFVNRSWVITEGAPGASDLLVTPQWIGTEELTDFDRTNAAVGLTTDAGATYTWADATAAVGFDPYTVAGFGFSDVGTFAVGDYFNAGKRLNMKLFLAGAYNGTTMAMDKDLNTAGLIPTTDPYGLSGDPVTVPADAVDWVKVQLRDQTTHAMLHEFPFFVDVNGNLLDTDGNAGGKVTGFDNTVPYYVAVLHRNHFGIMTSSTVDLSVTSPAVDYTTAQAQAWQNGTIGTNAAMKDVSSVFCLWDGDANGNGVINVSGASDDKQAILNLLGVSTPGNVIYGYNIEDVNMDGNTKVSGANDDKQTVLNVLGTSTPGNVYYIHLP